MARSRLVATVLVTVAVCGFMTSPAPTLGTWPASVQLGTSAAFPGDTVSFSGQGPLGVGSGNCVVMFDGVVVVGANCLFGKDGTIAGSFGIPADAATGTVTPVSVCWPGCYDNSFDAVPNFWQANSRLQIVAPFVEVPNVTCRPEEDATAMLTEAGFEVLVDRRIGDVVTDQEPRPGALLQQTVPVVLLLHGTLVPDLVGSTYDEAAAILERSCLVISAVDGITDGTVELQDPAAAAAVAGGTAVNVTMSGSAGSPTSTTAPTAPITTGPDSDPMSFPIVGPVSLPVAAAALSLLALAVLLVFLFGSGLSARANWSNRQVAWVAAHVTVTPRPGVGSAFETEPTDHNNRDHIITVKPEEVRHSTTVEEDPA
jgi:hypothetical protein